MLGILCASLMLASSTLDGTSVVVPLATGGTTAEAGAAQSSVERELRRLRLSVSNNFQRVFGDAGSCQPKSGDAQDERLTLLLADAQALYTDDQFVQMRDLLDEADAILATVEYRSEHALVPLWRAALYRSLGDLARADAELLAVFFLYPTSLIPPALFSPSFRRYAEEKRATLPRSVTVQIDDAPASACATLDGHPVSIPRFGVVPGKYLLRISAPGYSPIEQTLLVQTDKILRIPLAPHVPEALKLRIESITWTDEKAPSVLTEEERAVLAELVANAGGGSLAVVSRREDYYCAFIWSSTRPDVASRSGRMGDLRSAIDWIGSRIEGAIAAPPAKTVPSPVPTQTEPVPTPTDLVSLRVLASRGKMFAKGAVVFVDNVLVGETPYLGRHAPGTRSVRVELDGEVWSESVLLKPGVLGVAKANFSRPLRSGQVGAGLPEKRSSEHAIRFEVGITGGGSLQTLPSDIRVPREEWGFILGGEAEFRMKHIVLGVEGIYGGTGYPPTVPDETSQEELEHAQIRSGRAGAFMSLPIARWLELRASGHGIETKYLSATDEIVYASGGGVRGGLSFGFPVPVKDQQFWVWLDTFAGSDWIGTDTRLDVMDVRIRIGFRFAPPP